MKLGVGGAAGNHDWQQVNQCICNGPIVRRSVDCVIIPILHVNVYRSLFQSLSLSQFLFKSLSPPTSPSQITYINAWKRIKVFCRNQTRGGKNDEANSVKWWQEGWRSLDGNMVRFFQGWRAEIESAEEFRWFSSIWEETKPSKKRIRHSNVNLDRLQWTQWRKRVVCWSGNDGEIR